MEDIGKYFEKLDVLAPSFAISILLGWLFTKLFPSKSEKIQIYFNYKFHHFRKFIYSVGKENNIILDIQCKFEIII